jgi:PAS domain S-box-containing protein
VDVERLSGQAFLAAIVDSSDDAVIGKGLDGTILTWNRAAERMYGYSAQEAIGRNIDLLIPPGQADELPGILAKIRGGERIEHYQTLRQSRDGRYHEVSLSVSPVQDETGRVVAAATIARDISRRRYTERALVETNKALQQALAVRDRFLHMMNHELRTPLNSILGFIGVLLMGVSEPLTAAQRRHVETISVNADRLRYLVDALLELVEVETGSRAVSLAPVDARDLARKAGERLARHVNDRGSQIDIEVPDTPVMVETNAEIVSKVLSRASDNALTHGLAKTITISVQPPARPDGRLVRVSVADDGLGISAERLVGLRTAFERGEATAEALPGTGLGLYLSYRQLAGIGVSLDISSAPDQGTVVTIGLPFLSPVATT